MSVDKKIMQKILDEDVTFWLDNDNRTKVYVEFRDTKGAYRFEPFGSTFFLANLGYTYRQETGQKILPDFSDLLAIKCQDTIAEQENLVPINHRVTGSMKTQVSYFLGDDRRRTFVITPDGWKSMLKTREKFVKHEADMAQVKPVPGGDLLTLLQPYLNLSDNDCKLLTIWLVQAFSRQSSHYALIISSPKGTGKSTLTKLLRSLIDPSYSDASLKPNSESDLKNLLANTYMACFDNMEAVQGNYSNILCAAITGAKETKRKLYTDCDQIVLNLHNLVVLNGINIEPSQSDLAERSLLFELQKIDEGKRMTDDDFWSIFQRDKPAILGAIFDTLQKAMQILPGLKLEKLARMADAYKEMAAVAIALGISQEEFQEIFRANKDKLEASYVQNNPFIELVVNYVDRKKRVDAPGQQVYDELYESKGKGFKSFPESASALSKKLNLERGILEDAGISFSRHKRGNANYIRLEKIPQSQMTRKQKDTAKLLASMDE